VEFLRHILEHKDKDEEIESIQRPPKVARNDRAALIGGEGTEQVTHVSLKELRMMRSSLAYFFLLAGKKAPSVGWPDYCATLRYCR
jgi:hypothetical protein